jgi:hypothetical protein
MEHSERQLHLRTRRCGGCALTRRLKPPVSMRRGSARSSSSSYRPRRSPAAPK